MARRVPSGALWAALLAAAVVAAHSGARGQPLAAEVVDRARAAIVFVGVYHPRTDRLRASGSGFLVSPDGEIVTARHVATEAGSLRVFLASGQPSERRLPARVVALDRSSDLALLKIEAEGTPYLEIGDSGRLRETDTLFTAGFPLGMEMSTGDLGPAPSFRMGAVTSLRRSRYGGLVWLEMADGGEIGSSGGPVLDERGAVVGIVAQGGGRSTVLAVPSRRLISFLGERARLAAADAPALRAWLADPVQQAMALAEVGEYRRAEALLAPFGRDKSAPPPVRELAVGVREGLGELAAAIQGYEELLADFPADPRAVYWRQRLEQLRRYRGDGDPRNNFVICAPQRREVTVIDAGAGRVLETLRGLRWAPYAIHRPDGRFAYTRDRTAIVAVDLVVPQEAIYLRSDHAELGTTDWIAASADASVVALGISPEIQPTPSGSIVIARGSDLRAEPPRRFEEFFVAGYLTPDGRTLYLTSLPRGEAPRDRLRLHRLDLASGRLTLVSEHLPLVNWIAFPRGGPGAFGLRPDGSVVRIDLANGTVHPTRARSVNDLTAGPGAGELLLGTRQLVVWDAGRDDAIRRYDLPFPAYEVGATPDAAYYYAASEQRDRVAIVERATGRVTELRLAAPAPLDFTRLLPQGARRREP